MRLFVGIPLDPSLIPVLGRLIRDLREHVARVAPHARLTWVAPDRLHFTVQFIGQVDESRAEAIRQVLQAPLALAPFDVTLRGVGAFPSRGAPRVVWAGVAAGVDELRAVARAVGERLLELGIEAESRPYRAHLTLARVREDGGLRASALTTEGDAVLGAMRVSAVTLFESLLSSRGPTYVRLHETPFSGRR